MIEINYKERAQDLANDNIKLMDKNSSLNSKNKELKKQLNSLGTHNERTQSQMQSQVFEYYSVLGFSAQSSMYLSQIMEHEIDIKQVVILAKLGMINLK